MLLDVISCREGGISPYDFGHLSVTTTGQAIPIKLDFVANLPDEFGILISGYNMPGKEAEQSYQVIVDGMERAGIHLPWLGYTWPTGIGLSWIVPDLTRFFRKSNEKSEVISRASLAGQILRSLLQMCYQQGKRVKVIQTHSLGGRVGLVSLAAGDVHCEHLILSAPAVDDVVFEAGREFREVPLHCGTINVMCSAEDGVLKKLYHWANAGFDHALGLKGPKKSKDLPVNIRTFDFTRLVKDHSGYRQVPEYFNACHAVLYHPFEKTHITL